MKRFVLALALAVLPSAAFAQGIDLSWNDCVGTDGAANDLNFACTGTINNTYTLVLQFKSPVDIPNFVSLQAFLSIQSSSGTALSPFWRWEIHGGCQVAMNPSARIVTSTWLENIPGCNDKNLVDEVLNPWADEAISGLGSYVSDVPGSGIATVVALAARPYAVPIEQGVSQFGMVLRFTNRNRISCPGCSDPMVIRLDQAKLVSDDGSPVVSLVTPDQVGNCVTINGADPMLCGVLPARKTSWAGIKALYR